MVLFKVLMGSDCMCNCCIHDASCLFSSWSCWVLPSIQMNDADVHESWLSQLEEKSIAEIIQSAYNTFSGTAIYPLEVNYDIFSNSFIDLKEGIIHLGFSINCSPFGTFNCCILQQYFVQLFCCSERNAPWKTPQTSIYFKSLEQNLSNGQYDL